MEFGRMAARQRRQAGPWISERGDPSGPSHIAIGAPDRATVDAFYAAAIAAGGPTTARQDRARSTTRTTTAPSSSTPTGTTSRPSATARPSSRKTAARARDRATVKALGGRSSAGRAPGCGPWSRVRVPSLTLSGGARCWLLLSGFGFTRLKRVPKSRRSGTAMAKPRPIAQESGIGAATFLPQPSGIERHEEPTRHKQSRRTRYAQDRLLHARHPRRLYRRPT